MGNINIKNANELLKINLKIPSYQRPYKWEIRNMRELLIDIENAIGDWKKYGDEFKYRMGTIILHKDKDMDVYNVVDGQQRIISLVLIKVVLMKMLKLPNYEYSILNEKYTSKISKHNIKQNTTYIKEWLSLNSDEMKEALCNAFEQILEVVVIIVDKESEAFQLFDSHNSRGKALDPHDLLKAYHLREMDEPEYEIKRVVTKWEEKKTEDIRELFDTYLFPIWNWSKGRKTKTFTAKEIDIYKGISKDSSYTYALRAYKASPYYQITEPFISGIDFFEMVDHYLNLKEDIEAEIKTNFKKIYEILHEKKEYRTSTGFKHTRNLFYTALLCYYDRFRNFDKMAVKKLFKWALMLRVNMKRVGFDTVNRYAIGERGGDTYSNKIDMFAKICFARTCDEISGLLIEGELNSKNERWNKLFEDIMKCLIEE